MPKHVDLILLCRLCMTVVSIQCIHTYTHTHTHTYYVWKCKALKLAVFHGLAFISTLCVCGSNMAKFKGGFQSLPERSVMREQSCCLSVYYIVVVVIY